MNTFKDRIWPSNYKFGYTFLTEKRILFWPFLYSIYQSCRACFLLGMYNCTHMYAYTRFFHANMCAYNLNSCIHTWPITHLTAHVHTQAPGLVTTFGTGTHKLGMCNHMCLAFKIWSIVCINSMFYKRPNLWHYRQHTKVLSRNSAFSQNHRVIHICCTVSFFNFALHCGHCEENSRIF